MMIKSINEYKQKNYKSFSPCIEGCYLQIGIPCFDVEVISN